MFKNFSTRTGFLAAALVCASTAASALTLDFQINQNWERDWDFYTTNDGSMGVAVDGVQVDTDGTILASHTYRVGSWDGGGDPTRGGLGVQEYRYSNDTGLIGSVDNNNMIDGRGPDEFAIFDFGNYEVEITSITFTYWDGRDTFAYGVYEDTSILPASADIYVQELGSGNVTPYTHTFASGELVGSIIGFGADNWSDDFRIQGLTFEIVSAVPLPAGLALMLTGLGGLGLMRRRRKAA